MMKHPIYLLLPLLILWLGCGETGQNAETQSEETTTAEVYFCEVTPPADIQARAAALEETYKKLKEAEEDSEEKAKADFEVKEAALGHKVDTGIVSAYQRSDRLQKRGDLMRDWQDFLLSIH